MTWMGGDYRARNPIIATFCQHPNCGSRTHCGSNGDQAPCTVEICSQYNVQGVCIQPIETNRDWNSLLGGGRHLNAECVDTRYLSSSAFLMAQLDCSAAPPGSPMMAGLDGSRSSRGFMDLSKRAQLFVLLAAVLVIAFIFFSCTFLRKENYGMLVTMAGIINGFTMFLGVAVSVLALYVHTKRQDEGEESLWVSMAGQNAVYMTIGLGITMFLWGIWGIVSMGCARKDRNAPMAGFVLVLFCVIIVQTIGAFVVLIWVKDSYSLEAKTYSSLGSNEEGELGVTTTRTNIGFIDEALDKSMKDIELYTCNTYRKCCWTQESEQLTGTTTGGNATAMACTSSHGGSAVGAAKAELQDPSSHRFCELVAGGGGLGAAKGKTPVMAVCKGMEAASIFTGKDGAPGATLGQCKENFCGAGKAGYERFVTRTFSWLRDNFEWVFIIGGVFALGETTLLVVSVAIMRISHQAASSAHKKWEQRREEMAAKRTVVLNRGAGRVGGGGGSLETPGLKGGGYGHDTDVIGSFDPDAEWGASTIQKSFRASKANRSSAGHGAASSFEVEGEETYNPTFSNNGAAGDPGDPPPPSESDWGPLPPPSNSAWEGAEEEGYGYEQQQQRQGYGYGGGGYGEQQQEWSDLAPPAR
jgi:hypothetical protein